MADDSYSSGEQTPASVDPAVDAEAVERQESDRKEKNRKIHATALERFRLSEEAEADTRRLALEDLEFRAGRQWPDQVQADRDRDGRPCLVINRIPQFIQQITNDQRQNRPSIKVHPVDDKGDIETAKVNQGLIRHIEYNSSADVAYDTGFDSAATGGFGYWRVVTDFVNPLSFDQEILIKRIRNPLSVFFDPYSQEPDGSDANWAFVVEDLSPEEYKSRYPKSELASMEGWTSIGNQEPDWVKEGGCRVAEYFYKEFKEVEIVQLSTGEIVPAEALPDRIPDGVEVVRKRKASVPVVKWCKINGGEILEETDWLGIYIPIIPVYGTELDINGKRVLEGIVRNAKDPQRMYNYWASAETEAIALAPRAPFIAAEGQLEGHEADWASANRRNHSVLKYKPKSLDGSLLPPPQRNVFEPAVQAITQARGLASEDLKSTTGIYDATVGNRSNETSGIAIQRRNVQAQTSNFHFIDNLTRSLKHTGRILIDLIPKIYDTERTARIIGEDGEQRVVKVNAPFEEDGKTVLYRLDAGKYDVTVDVGPSFASKRQEAVASMLDVIKAYPQLAQFAGDLVVKNMDWPGAQEFADRIKKTMPPGLADDPKSKTQDVPPQVQAQMQQMNQMVEQLTQQLNDAKDKLENKTMELESKERIEFAKLESSARIELAKIDSTESVALLKQEILAINHRLQLLDIDQPIEDPSQQNSQFAPQDDGAMSAGFEGASQPTGGSAPGQPMEGNDPHAPY